MSSYCYCYCSITSGIFRCQSRALLSDCLYSKKVQPLTSWIERCISRPVHPRYQKPAILPCHSATSPKVHNRLITVISFHLCTHIVGFTVAVAILDRGGGEGQSRQEEQQMYGKLQLATLMNPPLYIGFLQKKYLYSLVVIYATFTGIFRRINNKEIKLQAHEYTIH